VSAVRFVVALIARTLSNQTAAAAVHFPDQAAYRQAYLAKSDQGFSVCDDAHRPDV